MMSTMQNFAAAVLLCVLAASTLPATSAQNPACTRYSQDLVNSCSNLITLYFSNPTLRQQGLALTGANDATIQSFISTSPSVKTPACCGALRETLSAGCRCDANVVPLAQGLGLRESQFYTVGRAGILACGLPKNTDTAPNPCSGSIVTDFPAYAAVAAPASGPASAPELAKELAKELASAPAYRCTAADGK